MTPSEIKNAEATKMLNRFSSSLPHPKAQSHHQERVNAFMHLAEQEIPPKPCIPLLEVRKLRAQLILEEALETINALGFAVNRYFEIDDDQFEPNLIEIVDGCCDLKVVTTGTLSAFGVRDAAVQFAVDSNNLQKFLPGGYKSASGKWIKPKDHPKPPIENILKDQAK